MAPVRKDAAQEEYAQKRTGRAYLALGRPMPARWARLLARTLLNSLVAHHAKERARNC